MSRDVHSCTHWLRPCNPPPPLLPLFFNPLLLFQVIAVNEIGESAASKESYYMITLREAPSGKPTITAAQNASSTALYLAWQPPHLSTLHGEFLGECTPGNRTLRILFA